MGSIDVTMGGAGVGVGVGSDGAIVGVGVGGGSWAAGVSDDTGAAAGGVAFGLSLSATFTHPQLSAHSNIRCIGARLLKARALREFFTIFCFVI